MYFALMSSIHDVHPKYALCRLEQLLGVFSTVTKDNGRNMVARNAKYSILWFDWDALWDSLIDVMLYAWLVSSDGTGEHVPYWWFPGGMAPPIWSLSTELRFFGCIYGDPHVRESSIVQCAGIWCICLRKLCPEETWREYQSRRAYTWKISNKHLRQAALATTTDVPLPYN